MHARGLFKTAADVGLCWKVQWWRERFFLHSSCTVQTGELCFELCWHAAVGRWYFCVCHGDGHSAMMPIYITLSNSSTESSGAGSACVRPSHLDVTPWGELCLSSFHTAAPLLQKAALLHAWTQMWAAETRQRDCSSALKVMVITG